MTLHAKICHFFYMPYARTSLVLAWITRQLLTFGGAGSSFSPSQVVSLWSSVRCVFQVCKWDQSLHPAIDLCLRQTCWLFTTWWWQWILGAWASVLLASETVRFPSWSSPSAVLAGSAGLDMEQKQVWTAKKSEIFHSLISVISADGYSLLPRSLIMEF